MAPQDPMRGFSNPYTLWIKALLVLAFLAPFAGCTVAADQVFPTPLPTATPLPTFTPTVTATPLPPTITLVPSPRPLISATPVFVANTLSPLTPSPTQLLPGSVRIAYFISDLKQVDPGQSLRLFWSVEGIDSAIIYRLTATGEREQQWRVGRNGSLQVSTRIDDQGPAQFKIVAGDAVTFVEQTISITLTCLGSIAPDPTTGGCPQGSIEGAAGLAISSPAAQQNFERGTLIWVGIESRIYILYNDGKTPAWNSYPDEFRDGLPDSDPALVPPSGLFQPVRGFGLVWRTNQTVRDRLGWAVSSELGFTAQVQGDATAQGGTAYITTPDNDVIKLENLGARWTRFTPSQQSPIPPITPTNPVATP